MGYIFAMKIKQTPRFKKWISALKDKQAKARILIRVYYIALENVIIVLLCGGDKSSQREDIERAKQMAAEARREAWKYKT